MAISLSNFLFAICAGAGLVNAATRTYDFSVGWVTRNPDGMHPRPVIGINGQWPIPRIEANVGDDMVVNMKNDLGNQSTSIHFHGLYQNGTSHMDGVAGATQCPVPPGSSFTYKFKVST
jgi:iron transport multicopper oxidase